MGRKRIDGFSLPSGNYKNFRSRAAEEEEEEAAASAVLLPDHKGLTQLLIWRKLQTRFVQIQA